MKRFLSQIAVLLTIVLIFTSLNISFYFLFTRRLGNHYGSSSQIRMIDVKRYLPFEKESRLAQVVTEKRFSEPLPVLDGAAALVPVYAAVINAVYPEGCVRYEGGVFSDDNYYGENFAEDSAMQYQNTIRGFTALVDGKTDVFFTAAPSEEQKNYAREKGVELVYVPIGLEAFVFFVNKNNPVNGLTLDQIRDIYAGEITNWSEVGGPDRRIDPVTRIAGSGSQSTMERLMGDRPIASKSPLCAFGASIAYSFRFYLQDMTGNDGVKMLSVNGVYPDFQNLTNGTYPLIAQFFAVYRADTENKNIAPLIEWLLSEEGQTLIRESGYAPIS